MARKMGLSGIHSMRKDQLVKALLKANKSKKTAAASSNQRKGGAAKGRGTGRSAAASKPHSPKSTASKSSASKNTASKSTASKSPASKSPVAKSATSKRSSPKDVSSKGAASNGAHGKSNGRAKGSSKTSASKRASDRVVRKIHKLHVQRETQRDLSHATTLAAKNSRRKKERPKPQPTPVPGKDRIVLLVRDPYWLQACWDVTRQSVARAKAALAEHWHTCEPVLRLMQVEAGSTTSTSERVVREIRVHGGVKNWYIDIKDSPNSYRVELGYRGENARFFVLSRSNVVTTPRPGSIDAIDENWADIAENYERIYALSGGYEPSTAGGDLQELFEEQLRRPMGTPMGSRASAGGAAPALRREKDFDFQVDAEMIIYGATKPEAHVTLSGEPVRLRPDGTFTVRLGMPDRRQLLPVVASSQDGAEQRTIVLAVERNTKVMEPMTREAHS